MNPSGEKIPLWRRLWRAGMPLRAQRALRRALRPTLYRGDYSSWAEARADSAGYDAPEILERTVTAARKVRDGHAAWERDSVTFSEPAANEPLLGALQHAASVNAGRLNVLDFGGALGSAWWQHRGWLQDLAEVRWSVVEQPQLAEIGRREFSVGPLRFYSSLTECVADEHPAVVLLSSVLPYLEQPHQLLARIRALPIRHVIIDRTGFVRRGRDRLTVQHVPPSIYRASYPCWFLDRESLLQPFQAEWRVLGEWVTGDDCDIDAEHGGVFLERILR